MVFKVAAIERTQAKLCRYSDSIVSADLRSIKIQSIFPPQYIYDSTNEENASEALLKVSSSVNSSGGRTLRLRIVEDKMIYFS